ncbi:MAG: hypothetical protein LBS88_09400 [Tannerellaceae bacterium]|jgi:hypothetical protein|nr:hypothetical protein [Tannerellaceae bacterium]
MKKLFYSGLMAACMMMMASCLESGSNEQQREGAVGVIRFDTKSMKMVIECFDFYPFLYYAPGLETTELNDGDCVLFGYVVDLSNEANTDYQTTGIIQGNISTISRLDQFPCSPYLIDTAKLMEKEQPIAYAVSSNGGYLYFSQKLFVASNFSYKEKQQTDWHLYYDPELPAKNVDGKNVYSLFLRATIKVEDSTGSTQNGNVIINTFNAENFFNATQNLEKNLGKDKVYFRINHIKEIKEDSTFVWAESDLLDINIAQSE